MFGANLQFPELLAEVPAVRVDATDPVVCQ